MKLLIITAVQEFSKDIKDLLLKSNIKLFSYNEIIGHRDFNNNSLEENWFSGEITEIQSVIFYAFVKKTNAEHLFIKVNEFNEHQVSVSKVHVSILNIEKSN